MKRGFIKILLFAGILFFAGFISLAHADTVMYEGLQNSQTINSGTGAKKIHTITYSGSFPEPLKRIEIWYYTNGSVATDDSNIEIRRGGITIATTTTGETFNGGSNPSPGGYNSSGSYNFNITQPTLQNGDEVWINVTNIGGGAPNYVTPSGKYLKIYSGVTSATQSISFLNPVDGQNLSGDFTHFLVSGNSGTSGFCPVARIEYGTGTTTQTWSDSANNGQCYTASSTFQIYVRKSHGGLQNWNNAVAYLENTNGVVVASTSLINFNIIGAYTSWSGPTDQDGNPIFINLSTPTAGDVTDSENYWFVDCSAYEGAPFFSSSTLPGIICGFKKGSLEVAQKLFEPDPDILQEYSSITFDDKFPFSYWASIKEISADINSTSTGEFPTLTLHVPNFVTKNSTSTNLAVFSSSTISTYVGSSKISLFKDLIGYALWIMFFFHIYHRAKNIFSKPNNQP